MSDFLDNYIPSAIELIVLSLVMVVAFVWFLRLFDKDYKEQNSLESKTKNLEEKLTLQKEELKHLLPKVAPLEEQAFQFKYDPKKGRKLETELLNLKRRIKTLERYIEQDSKKLSALKDKK